MKAYIAELKAEIQELRRDAALGAAVRKAYGDREPWEFDVVWGGPDGKLFDAIIDAICDTLELEQLATLEAERDADD